jgi:hypothetical protein
MAGARSSSLKGYLNIRDILDMDRGVEGCPLLQRGMRQKSRCIL